MGDFELRAGVDKASGCVVLYKEDGDIFAYVADGKMRVERSGVECRSCVTANRVAAKRVAETWNAFKPSKIIAHRDRPVCNLGAKP